MPILFIPSEKFASVHSWLLLTLQIQAAGIMPNKNAEYWRIYHKVSSAFMISSSVNYLIYIPEYHHGQILGALAFIYLECLLLHFVVEKIILRINIVKHCQPFFSLAQ